jgi:hypothetical protein
MLQISFDMSELEQRARELGAAQDQIPYALALAMNEAADVTRNLLIKATWPSHVQARNKSFIAASLTTRGARANKRSLEVEIYDKLDRGNLQMQAKGGTRTPHGGSSLAVPASNVTRTARGVPARLRPKNMPTAVRKGDVLYARDKKSGRLRLLYVLKHTTAIPKRVPFYEDFATSMQRELVRTIPHAVAKAMATRRR